VPVVFSISTCLRNVPMSQIAVVLNEILNVSFMSLRAVFFHAMRTVIAKKSGGN